MTLSLIPWCAPDPLACDGGTQATVASRPRLRCAPGAVRPPEPPVPGTACPAGLALVEPPGLLVPGVLPADALGLLPEHAARPGITIAATAQAAIQRCFMASPSYSLHACRRALSPPGRTTFQ